MTDLRFNFSRRPNHYDVSREKRSIVKQRENFIKKMREYRADERTIFHTDETWANKNMTPGRIWTDKSSRARLNVPYGKGARIIIAQVGSRKTGLVPGASLVFKGKKKKGDYHGEMNSVVWLKWLQDQVLPKIGGAVLVVDRAPYHMKLTDESRPADSSIKKSQLSDCLEEHDAAPTNWPPTWRSAKTVAQMRAQAAKHRMTPRYLVQDLAEEFDVSNIFSPLAHPELNPIEMVWGTVKVALRYANVTFNLTRLRELVDVEFNKISAAIWAKYEDHAISMEDYYMDMAAMRAEVEDRADEIDIELEDAEVDGVNGCSSSEEDGEDEADKNEEDGERMRLCRRGHDLIWALTEKCFEGVTDFSMSKRLAWRQRFNL